MLNKFNIEDSLPTPTFKTLGREFVAEIQFGFLITSHPNCLHLLDILQLYLSS